jgi:subfamily B ATP-binding cassette protein MsbA
MSSDSPTLRRRLARAVQHFKRPTSAWIATVASVILISLTEPLIPALMKPLLDQGFGQNSFSIWLVPIALILLFLIRGACAFTGQVALAKVANTGLLSLRLQMFQSMLHAHPSLFARSNASALSNSMVYEIQTGANFLVNGLLTLGRDSLTLITMVSYLLYLNWKLTTVVFVLFPCVAWIMKVMTKRLYRLTTSFQLATDELAYSVEENVLAHRVIRLQGAQSQQFERFESIGQSLHRLIMKSAVAGSAITPLTQILSAMALSLVISIALFQSQNTGTTVGEFTAFITAMLMLIAPIKHLSEVSAPLTRGLAAIERAMSLVESTPVETSGAHRQARAKGDIQFQGLRVQYDPQSPDALNIPTLHIQPGQTVAFVGASGAGKTTLVNLIPRFVDATEGKVLLDGQSVVDWNLHDLRRQIAMVSQDVVVLNLTLAENVALGMPLDEQRVMECLTSAQLMDVVQELPMGIHNLVGHNASQLSGGQRQRLAIARALYKDAPILILDEATSALDNESERQVQIALAHLQKGRTTLVIAHRLSTVEHADHIVVMDQGRIVEQGNHTALLQADEAYAALFKLGSIERNLDSSS